MNPAASARRFAGPVLGVLLTFFVFSQANTASDFFQFTMIGIAVGSVYAISAAGLVLTYTTTGVFNFAHGAVGMVAAYLYFQLKVQQGWPTPIAMVVVIVVLGPLVGLVLERIMRSFAGASAGTTLTVTIALTVMLIGLIQTIFPDDQAARVVPSFFGNDKTIEVFGARLPWDRLFVMAIALAVAVALRYLLYVSRTGVAMRAVVDNPDLASLNGTNPVMIARFSWILGSTLAALAGVLIAPGQGALQAAVFAFTVVTAFGAAVVGKLRSLPLTFAGAISLGVLQNWMSGIVLVKQDSIIGDRFLTVIPWSSVSTALPGLFLLAALLFLPEQRLSVGRLVGRDEPRTPSLRESAVGAVVFVGAVSLISAVMPSDYLLDAGRSMVYAVLLLSLVVLTGFSGQISLAQYVFLGVGAWAMGSVGGGDSILGLVAAAAVAVPLGAIVALPALRLTGLYLALSTFAIAVASRELIFQNDSVYGIDNQVVGRLNLLGLDFSGNRVFIVLCAGIFAIVAVGVLAIRRSAFGRRLSAVRDSPAACATLGLDIRRTKLIVFCTSSAIAGLAGGLFGGVNASVGTIDFESINNVVLFLFAFVGGVTTITGALIGGILFALLPLVQSESPSLAGVVFAAVAIAAVLLGKQPNGMAGLLYERLARWKAGPAVPELGEPDATLITPSVVPEAQHASH
ncbi:ABC transporter permease [Actinospongicola halichondriae]|uniref:ABC transporter permease n=1 Tax=Actinospongicola halichondriae TaxID=3236844 RepID=UPI003D44F27C